MPNINPIVLTADFLARVTDSQNFARDKANTEARESSKRMERTQHDKTVYQEQLSRAQYGIAGFTAFLLVFGAAIAMKGEDFANWSSNITTATNVMPQIGQGVNSAIQAKVDIQQHLIGEDQRKRQQADERKSGIGSAITRCYEAAQQIMENCGRLFVIKG